MGGRPPRRTQGVAADLPDDELLAYWRQMQDDSYRAFLDMVALDLPRAERIRTPLLVPGVGRDNMIAPAEIADTARAYGTHAEIVPEAAHDSMLDPRWRNVAERILAWLADRAYGGFGTGERDTQDRSKAERWAESCAPTTTRSLDRPVFSSGGSCWNSQAQAIAHHTAGDPENWPGHLEQLAFLRGRLGLQRQPLPLARPTAVKARSHQLVFAHERPSNEL